MENNSFSPLETGMKAATCNENNDKLKDSSAENLLAIIASILFWVSTIGFCIDAIAGIVMMLKGASAGPYDSDAKFSWIGLLVIIVSSICYLICLVAWAKLKVYLNISRNLFVIKCLMLEDRISIKKDYQDTV